MADAGTELTHESGHLHGGWDAFASHIAQEQTFYAVAVGSAAVSLEGLDQWERATTDKYGWLTADDLGADERPAHPDIPDLMRAAAASVGIRS